MISWQFGRFLLNVAIPFYHKIGLHKFTTATEIKLNKFLEQFSWTIWHIQPWTIWEFIFCMICFARSSTTGLSFGLFGNLYQNYTSLNFELGNFLPIMILSTFLYPLFTQESDFFVRLSLLFATWHPWSAK